MALVQPQRGGMFIESKPMSHNVSLPLVIVGVFAALFAAERVFPLRRSRGVLAARLVVNLAISGSAFLTAMIAVRPSALKALDWTSQQPFGLLHLVAAPGWAQFLIGFLLIDLTFYYWHIANHKIPLLWRFHNVHHIDPDLDVSTGFRFHFGEVLLSTLFRATQVILIGMSLTTLVVYEMVFQANTLFHHSNVRLPIQVERILNKVLVTPRMHGIHHSQVQREANSNFGVVFRWWDKLHKTLGLNIPQSTIEIGVPAYTSPEDNSLWSAFILPFRRQRDYWRKSDGRTPERANTNSPDDESHMAE